MTHECRLWATTSSTATFSFKGNNGGHIQVIYPSGSLTTRWIVRVLDAMDFTVLLPCSCKLRLNKVSIFVLFYKLDSATCAPTSEAKVVNGGG